MTSWFFLLLLGELNLKAPFDLVPADIMKHLDITYVMSLQESYQILLVFPYLCPNKCFLHHIYAKKGFCKHFGLQWYFVSILLINEVGFTWRTNI